MIKIEVLMNLQITTEYNNERLLPLNTYFIILMRVSSQILLIFTLLYHDLIIKSIEKLSVYY